MPTIGPLEPSSQLEAVNACLSAIGEAPVEDISSSTRADVALATQLLTESSKEVQLQGWRFNREFGYEVAPAGQVLWTGSDATTATLNVFIPPTGLLRWGLTETSLQSSLSLIVRAPRAYLGAAPFGVFYDRKLNRDGLDADIYDVLYLDPVFFVEWAYLPESAKQYITLRAARKFAARSLGSNDIVGFALRDEQLSLKNLYEDQALEDEFNVFDSADVNRIRSGRLLGPSGAMFQNRNSPRPV